MMLRAVQLARRGEGFVEPNPMVGCVLTREGRIIGEGFHHRFGGPHAEVNALRACKANPRGATCYVTLEPCDHFGKTPPCTDALIAAGIARVVVALRDPNPLVHGRGIQRLRRAGIVVETGVCASEATRLIAPFATRVALGRPYVIAKWAQSLDGRLATRTRDSRWISGEVSRRHVHRLRARADAILVGSGTVLADDPLLTARGVRLRRTALRVVLDARLRTPESCQLLATIGTVPVLIFTSATGAHGPKARRLRARGVDVEVVPRAHGSLSLHGVLQRLARRGVTNLMVEGGPTVLSSFFDLNLVDEAHIFVAPMLIGGAAAPSVWTGRGVAQIRKIRKPAWARVQRCGEDVHYTLRWCDPSSGTAQIHPHRSGHDGTRIRT